jgi:hypothetical protein
MVVGNELVQGLVDLKGFKGKGDVTLVRAWARRAAIKMQSVHEEMRLLKRESTGIAGHQFYLEVQSVLKRDRKSMRWRMRDGKHTRWVNLQGLLRLMPDDMAFWYREANLRAGWLNAQEIAAHAEWRSANDFLESVNTVLSEADY